jgi:hypothetical protein
MRMLGDVSSLYQPCSNQSTDLYPQFLLSKGTMMYLPCRWHGCFRVCCFLCRSFVLGRWFSLVLVFPSDQLNSGIVVQSERSFDRGDYLAIGFIFTRDDGGWTTP